MHTQKQVEHGAEADWKLTGDVRIRIRQSALRVEQLAQLRTSGDLNAFSKQGNSVWKTSHLDVIRKLEEDFGANGN